MERSRRRFLRAGGGLAATGALSALAGCGGSGDGGSGDGTTTSGGDAGEDGSGALRPFARWLYAPGTVVDRNHYAFSTVDYADVRSNSDALGDAYGRLKRAVERRIGSLGIGWESLERSVEIDQTDDAGSGPQTTVLSGSFGASDVEAAQREAGYQKAGKHRGYAVYEGGDGGDGPAVVAVGDGAWVGGRGENALAGVEATIDARDGETERYVAASEDCATLVGALPAGIRAGGKTHRQYTESGEMGMGLEPHFEGQVATGDGLTVDGGTATHETVIVYRAGEFAERPPVQTWVDQLRDGEAGAIARADSVEIAVEGAVVTVLATLPAGEAFGPASRLSGPSAATGTRD